MPFIVSLISTLKGVGLAPDFIAVWPPAWGLSRLVASPTLLPVLPVLRRIVGRICRPVS